MKKIEHCCLTPLVSYWLSWGGGGGLVSLFPAEGGAALQIQYWNKKQEERQMTFYGVTCNAFYKIRLNYQLAINCG